MAGYRKSIAYFDDASEEFAYQGEDLSQEPGEQQVL